MKKRYLVAGHSFLFDIEDNSPMWSNIARAYSKFEIEGDGENLFSVRLVEELDMEGLKPIYTDKNPEPGFVKIEVFASPSGLYMELTQYGSEKVNGKMLLSDGGEISAALFGDTMERWFTFTNVVQVAYFYLTSTLDTVMMHASAILYNGKSYLFLGKSGTGKSTHSRMWLKAIEGTSLMNDDHPIVRVLEDGTVMAYGSPWSGKTHCYHNIAAPVGAIVRIRQEKENVIRRLKPIESYGSVMVSCSGFPLNEIVSEGKSSTLQKVVKGAACWELGCLPDEAAAIVCRDAVVGL